MALVLALGVLASLLFAAYRAEPAKAADDEEVVLTIGTSQDVDSMNPYAGVVLSAYEVWNMQYSFLDQHERGHDGARSPTSPRPGSARPTVSPGPTTCATT